MMTKLNRTQLKYALEVEKTKSINKAAENLFMGQPNLSRSIKDLENNLGILIFKRTPKGIFPTKEGEEFLSYAKNIMAEIENVERIYTGRKNKKQKFSLAAPRTCYVAEAFRSFIKTLDKNKPIEMYYKETNASEVIKSVLGHDYDLGIVRYQDIFENEFKTLLQEKNLQEIKLWEYDTLVSMSKNHPLASVNSLTNDMLMDYVEIAHGDPYVPTLPNFEIRKAELSENVNKRIFVYERASQADILCKMNDTYMWGAPAPEFYLDIFDLTQKECKENSKHYFDVIIFRKGFKFSELDNQFISYLTRNIETNFPTNHS